MKYLFALCVLAFVALSTSSPDRGCIYADGMCVRECEEGTHSYTSGCGPKIPEHTCDQPNPVQERGATCDYSACYCDFPKVRNTISGKCVFLEECPKK